MKKNRRLSPTGWRRILLLLACVLSLIFVATIEASAQDTGNVSSEAEDANIILDSNDLRLFAAPAQAVSADTSAPVQVDFRITGMPTTEDGTSEGDPTATEATSPDVPLTSLSGVIFRGYTRFVAATEEEAPTYGQVIITRLERGSRSARLDGFGATWELDPDADGIEAGEQLVIEGNAKALETALAALEAPAKETSGKEPELRVESKGEPVTEAVGQPGGGAEKSDYKTPAPVGAKPESTTETAKTAKTEAKPERACIDGAIRVDTELGVAFERRQVWLPSKNEYAACYDSQKPSERYALKKNYASCAVGIEGKKATARFQRYFTKAGAIKLVGVCVDDPDLTFDITESHAGCQVQIDETQAIPHADLGYTNRAGRRVQIRGCAPSTTKAPVRLVTMTDECNIRHADNKAIIRGVDTYTLEGVTHQVGVCKDTDTVFAHQTDFEGCPVDVDIKAKRAIARSRTIYRDGNGEVIEVRGCRPDESRTFSITEDVTACDVAIDYTARTATPHAKLVYLNHERAQVEVRGCAPATTSRAVTLASDTSACAMRHDFAGLRTHERATYSYQLGGGTFTIATCRETGRNYALVKDYAACEAEIEERAGGRVVTKFRWGFQDAGGKKQFASPCAPDPELIAGVAEDHASCTVAIDYDTGQATPQARLVFTDRNGQVQEVRGCAASTSKSPVRLTSNVNACEADIDLRAGSVTEKASYSYSLDGEIRQASDCRATGRTFEITRDYDSCETAIDLNSKRATDLFRLVYQDASRKVIEAAACAPDRTRQFTITEDFTACDVAIDYTTNTATPHAKLVYHDSTRQVVEVQDCAPSTIKRPVQLIVDTSSCDMRMDIPGLKIYEQAAYSYRLDGGQHEASTCRDTGNSFALVKDYDGCNDNIDIAGKRVTTHARWSYLDKRGKRHAAGACAAEQELVFDIVEDHVACKIDMDFKVGTVTPQSRLVFTNRNGQITEVQGCATSGTKAQVSLVADTTSCPADIDLRRLNVTQKAKYSYSLGGEIKQASDCRATGRTFEITRDYASCETAIDLSGKRATDLFRLVYEDGNGKVIEAKACAPDRTRQFVIAEDFTACDVAVDYDGRKAIPHARLVYQDQNRAQVEVRGCAPATTKRAVSLTLDKAACEMRMDLVEGRIHERVTYSYSLDGGSFTPAECRETGQNFPLVKDYAACAIDVDVGRKTAIEHYRWAYQDANKRKQFASPCAANPELVYAITEDRTACAINIDYETGMATPQARLIYTDRNSQITEVRGCGASAEKHPIRLTAKTAGCKVRADIGSGKVHELASYSYRLDGEIKQASECRETGRTFALTRDHDSCDMNVDTSAMRATGSYQLVYNDGDGQRQTLGACQADRDRVYTIREDKSGCQIEIDYDGLQAIPQSKLVYNGFGGREVEVRGCAASTSQDAVPLTLDKTACEMRYDYTGKKAHEKATYSYELGGGSYTAATCRETGKSFIMDQSYSACPITTNLTRMKAQARYKWFYIDGAGENQDVGECIDDAELIFDIREDNTACKIFLDYKALRAVPQALLYYNNQHGQRTEIRGCEASNSISPVRMISRTDVCQLRHDMAAGTSHELGIHTYILNGIVYQASTCSDTGRTFAHKKTYLGESRQNLCEPIINRSSKQVTKQYRLQINVDGRKQFVSECTPDKSAKLAIQSTNDGCDDPASWQHDLSSGISYAMERFYYRSSTGGRTYVSGCQNAATTYRHDHTITGYQYNDAQLTAWPTTRVVITPPSGRYVVDAGRVLPGATQIPYVKLTTVDEVSGETRYEGCNAYRLTNRYERWRRPDKSIYNKPIGAGAARGPEAVCRTQIAPWRLTGKRKAVFDETVSGGCRTVLTEHSSYETGCYTHHIYRAFAEYLGNRKLIREDGTIVANNDMRRWRQFVRLAKGWHGRGTFSIGASFTGKNQPPATMTGSKTSSWEQDLGWR